MPHNEPRARTSHYLCPTGRSGMTPAEHPAPHHPHPATHDAYAATAPHPAHTSDQPETGTTTPLARQPPARPRQPRRPDPMPPASGARLTTGWRSARSRSGSSAPPDAAGSPCPPTGVPGSPPAWSPNSKHAAGPSHPNYAHNPTPARSPSLTDPGPHAGQRRRGTVRIRRVARQLRFLLAACRNAYSAPSASARYSCARSVVKSGARP